MLLPSGTLLPDIPECQLIERRSDSRLGTRPRHQLPVASQQKSTEETAGKLEGGVRKQCEGGATTGCSCLIARMGGDPYP